MRYRVVARSESAFSKDKIKCHISSYNTDKAWRTTNMDIVQIGDVLAVRAVIRVVV